MAKPVENRNQQLAETKRRENLPARRSLLSMSPREVLSASPFELFRRLSDEMDRAFEHWYRSPAEGAVWTPPVEIYEENNNLIVRAELPGLKKDEVKIEVADDGLVIHGERKSERETRKEGLYRSEWTYGEFYRRIPLPEEVDPEKAKAEFHHGILEIKMPIVESTKRREIPIEVRETEQHENGGGSRG